MLTLFYIITKQTEQNIAIQSPYLIMNKNWSSYILIDDETNNLLETKRKNPEIDYTRVCIVHCK